MIDTARADLDEPSITQAMWRYWMVVVAAIVLFAGFAFVLALTRPAQYEASAGLAVRDPGLSDLFSSTRTIPADRYVIDQAEILRSDIVHQRASEFAAAGEPSIDIDPGELRRRTSIDFDPDADFIGVATRAGTPEEAQALANAVALAYQDITQAEVEATSARLLAQLDDAIDEVEVELDSLRTDMQEAVLSSPARAELDQQIDELIAELIQLREATDQPGADELNSIEFIKQELEARRLIQDLQNAAPDVAALLQRQQESENVREALRLRRGEILATAANSGSGVTLYSPASAGVAVGISGLLAIQAGAVLGLLAGAAASYYLALRRVEIQDPEQAETLLQSPLIGVVAKAPRKESPLPSRDAPSSREAEAFRFILGALASSENRTVRELRGSFRALGTVAFVSARPGDGKSTVLANIAVEAAYQGRDVLVVDADFGHQQVSRLLLKSDKPRIGLTEVVLNSTPLATAATTVPLKGSSTLHVLSRGRLPVTGPDFFYAPATQDFLRKAGEFYDLVLVDTPALLGVAYTASIIQHVDRIVAVVNHRSPIAAVHDLNHRLELNETPLTGYVYNRGPALPIRSGEGSMADVLGLHSRSWATGSGQNTP